MSVRSLRLLLAAAATALVGLPSAASAAALAKNAAISVIDFQFQPATATISVGGTVTWSFKGGVSHTATDATGMNLYASGAHAAGTSFAFTFIAAGSYPFLCSIHPLAMKGTISVPMKLKPRTGGTATSFKLTWSSKAAPAGLVFDVQVQRPNAAGFVNLASGTTAPSTNFRPDAGRGTYRFQARLRRSATGTASGFSPAKAITVS